MRTILVIDDDAKINLMLTLVLRRHGFTVMRVACAVEAHQFLKEKGPVDLALLDINMPVVSGDELNQVMQLFHYHTKVIVCSVLPIEEQIKRIPDAADYHDKSDSFVSLLKKIDLVLEGDRENVPLN